MALTFISRHFRMPRSHSRKLLQLWLGQYCGKVENSNTSRFVVDIFQAFLKVLRYSDKQFNGQGHVVVAILHRPKCMCLRITYIVTSYINSKQMKTQRWVAFSGTGTSGPARLPPLIT